MSYKKWISGAIGWAIAGPIGAIIGYAIASVLENKEALEVPKQQRRYSPVEERNSFLLSLLVLTSAVMKADGKVMRSELTFVKNYLVKNFGEDAGAEAVKYLRELLNKDVNVESVGAQISRHMSYEARIQLLHYLAGIANADGAISDAEARLLFIIAAAMGVSILDCRSVIAMYSQKRESEYEILEITSSATDQEIKNAYRALAVKHHPDKVAHLGKDVQMAAEEKFKKINEAYESLKKARGFN